jgi:hypothetical protein
MKRTSVPLLTLCLLFPLAVGCGSATPPAPPAGPIDPAEAPFDPLLFDAMSASVQFDFWPLVPGTVYTYRGETSEGTETIVIEVTDQTRMVMGVECIVVHDEAYLDGELVEDTWDWYAQAIDAAPCPGS